MKLIARYPKNPILTKDHIPFDCKAVYNTGVCLFEEKTILLLRVEHHSGISTLHVAESTNGTDFKVRSKPILDPEQIPAPYAEYGLEDPRITYLDGIYCIFATAYSRFQPCVVLITTRDFQKFTYEGIVAEPSNKNCVLFPEKWNGHYLRLDRPYSDHRADMWLSSSPDLKHWGNHKVVLSPRAGHWDSARVGAGAPPFKTKEGWLEIYHGAKVTLSGSLYCLGLILLDSNYPDRVLKRSENPILEPEEPYERTGFVPNVVFCCGTIVEPNGQVNIYYGAADTSVCLATTSVDALLASL